MCGEKSQQTVLTVVLGVKVIIPICVVTSFKINVVRYGKRNVPLPPLARAILHIQWGKSRQ